MPQDSIDRTTRQSFPWNTGPTKGLGSTRCAWCDRTIYLPAVPCSVEPIAGLMEMATAPGMGDRCKWELSTRAPPAGAIGSRDRVDTADAL